VFVGGYGERGREGISVSIVRFHDELICFFTTFIYSDRIAIATNRKSYMHAS
jgi:hypothetical protein